MEDTPATLPIGQGGGRTVAVSQPIAFNPDLEKEIRSASTTTGVFLTLELLVILFIVVFNFFHLGEVTYSVDSALQLAVLGIVTQFIVISAFTKRLGLLNMVMTFLAMVWTGLVIAFAVMLRIDCANIVEPFCEAEATTATILLILYSLLFIFFIVSFIYAFSVSSAIFEVRRQRSDFQRVVITTTDPFVGKRYVQHAIAAAEAFRSLDKTIAFIGANADEPKRNLSPEELALKKKEFRSSTRSNRTFIMILLLLELALTLTLVIINFVNLKTVSYSIDSLLQLAALAIGTQIGVIWAGSGFLSIVNIVASIIAAISTLVVIIFSIGLMSGCASTPEPFCADESSLATTLLILYVLLFIFYVGSVVYAVIINGKISTIEAAQARFITRLVQTTPTAPAIVAVNAIFKYDNAHKDSMAKAGTVAASTWGHVRRFTLLGSLMKRLAPGGRAARRKQRT